MASQPEKILLHRQRERVLAISRLFEPDPERPGEIAPTARALPLPEGLSCLARAADELVKFLDSPFADVRRLAASAFGKMAPEKPAAMSFLLRLAELAQSDAHPQVRQYAAKAIGRYPREALAVIDVMKDVARDETAPAYVRTAAAETVAAIQTAARKQSGYSVEKYFCRRCRRRVSEEEYQSSMERFGRTYCRHCLDERELESHDFESMVEAAKVKRTTGGTAVQSWGEKRIAEFLEAEKIAFYYDERYRITGADTVRPDFYLPEFDLYIEYYGMDTPEYNENRRRKHILYQRAAKKLISVSFKDDANLIAVLKEKLSRYIRFAEKADKDPGGIG